MKQRKKRRNSKQKETKKQTTLQEKGKENETAKDKKFEFSMNGVKELDNKIKQEQKRYSKRKAQKAIHESIEKKNDGYVHDLSFFHLSFGKGWSMMDAKVTGICYQIVCVFEKSFLEHFKERDVDNDGTPDRIDIDDTKNAVQTVGDLNKIKNATSKEIQEENERRTGKKTKSNRHDRGL
ncbi:hypothetical protein ACT7C1_11565 [Bacillus paranthracis]